MRYILPDIITDCLEFPCHIKETFSRAKILNVYCRNVLSAKFEEDLVLVRVIFEVNDA